ncbi:MAG: hypothetical protein QNJ55_36480 [Xenococcus sp. MO_188.B8]|nr:hypothetical protein [Xenococcus sp. MO_188.B8]
MSSNLSIERGIEKFSFIYTLTVYCPGNSNPTENYQPRQDSPKTISQDYASDSYWEKSVPSSDSPSSQQSSALSKTDSPDTASLAVSHPTTILNDWYGLKTDDNYKLDLSSLNALPESDIEDNSSGKKIALDKLFLIASGGYLIFVSWWLFAQITGRNIIPFLVSNNETISKADAEFLDYMQRALDNIDRQVIAQAKTSAKEEENPTVVYVPVYNQPQTNPFASYNHQPLAPTIPLPPSPPSEFTALEPPAKMPLLPAPSESTNLKIAEIPQTADNKVATAIATPEINSTLVGLIELGEASAALFKIDGITQRIWLGENIENTGWVLESVTKEKATVTYQGQSRILSIGESL